jgi:hypothetical protein
LINLDEDSFSSDESDSSDENEGQKSMFEEAGIGGKGTTKVAHSGSEGGAKYAATPGGPDNAQT